MDPEANQQGGTPHVDTVNQGFSDLPPSDATIEGCK
jgi:hypothetical protein